MRLQYSLGSVCLRWFAIICLVALALGAMPVYLTQAYNGGYALNFDGVSDAVRVGPANSGLAIMGPDCLNQKSVTVWARPMGGSPDIGYVGAGDVIVGDGPNWFGIVRGSIGGVDRIWVYNNDSDLQPIEQIGIPYTTGEWVHIALVHAGGQLKAYKNGVLVSQLASGATAAGGPGCLSIFIGGQATGPQPYPDFEGQIDEVSFWGKELTAAEIRQIMNAGLIGNEASLGAYFKMANGSGTTVTNDTGDTTYNGVFITGSPDWMASGAMAGPDNALDFDGTNDYVSVAPSIAMPANLTLEAWVYPRDVTAGQKWVAGEVGGAQLVSDGSTINFYIHDGVSLQGPANATLAANQWQHVAGVFDGTTLSVYVDGVKGIDALHSGANQDQGNPFTLGSPDGITQVNSLILDEVRLWNSARNADQIRTGMAQSLIGDESGLVAYYRFDQYNTADQTILYDVTTNNNDGTLSGMDGTSDWVTSSAFNTWVGSDGADWSASGNWSRYTAPVAGDTVGVYAGTLANNPILSAAASFDSIMIAPGGYLTISASGSLNPSGRVFNYGALSQARTVNAATVNFLGSGGYGGVTIDPGGDNLGSVTVTFKGNQECTTTGSDTVMRCFDISATNQPSAATVTFFFEESELNGNACNDLELYHFDGSWTLVGLDGTYGTNGRDCSSTPRSVRATGINAFSAFVLDSPPAPTAVSLIHFGVSSQGRALTWILPLAGVGGLGVALLIFARRRKS